MKKIFQKNYAKKIFDKCGKNGYNGNCKNKQDGDRKKQKTRRLKEKTL